MTRAYTPLPPPANSGEIGRYVHAELQRIAQTAQALTNNVTWGGVYSPGKTYYPGQLVVEWPYAAICMQKTDSQIAPVPTGPREWDKADAFNFATEGRTAVVAAGQTYTFSQSGFYGGLRVWVPEVTPDYTFRVIALDSTDPANPTTAIINSPELTAGQWSVLQVTEQIVVPGMVLTISIEAFNSGANTLVTGGWTRAADNNDVTIDPGLGNWGTQANDTSLRINKTDADSVDRSTELLSMVAGTDVQIVNTLDANQSQAWLINGPPVDQGTHISWSDVTYLGAGPSGEPPIGAICTMTGTVPVPANTKNTRNNSYYTAGNQPTWAHVDGFMTIDGVVQGGRDIYAYGVDINFTPAQVSPDWQIISAA